jgi:putative MATE family efflux protein
LAMAEKISQENLPESRPAGNSITEGVIWKQLLIFFFPIVMGTFFQQLYNTIDAAIVGNYVGKEALAAVGGTTGTLINLLVGFFVGLASGATVIISQFYGGGDIRRVGRAIHTAAALAIIGSVLLMVLGLAFSPWALRLMGTPPEIMAHALVYIRVYFAGIFFNMVYNIGSGILRAVGDSRRPLYFLIVCCFVNVLLDLLFVAVFQWGIFGAALATILSQAVSAALIILVLIKTDQAYRMDVKAIHIDPVILKSIIRIGIPAGLQSVLYSVSNLVIQASVNSFGTDVVAAWTAYGKLDGFFWMVISSFGIAITTFVGQNFGAGNYGRMRRSVRVCLAMTFGTTAAITGLFLLVGEAFYHIFTQDQVVIGYGMEMVRFLAPVYFTYVCIEILSGAVRGVGDSLIPTIITCFGVCALRVLWIALAVPAWPNIRTTMASYPITWTITSIAFIVYYLRGGWLKRQIAAKEKEAKADGA